MNRKAVVNIRETEEVSWAGKMIISIVDLVSLRFKGATWCRNPAGVRNGGLNLERTIGLKNEKRFWSSK